MTKAKFSTDATSSSTTLGAALQRAGLAPTQSAPMQSVPAAGAPKTRRIVAPAPQTTLTPSPAKDINKAMKSLKTSAPAAPVSTIVEAPKTRKTHEGVTITLTKEMVKQPEGEPIEMLVLTKRHISDGTISVKGKRQSKGTILSHYNYAFDKGYCYYATKGATPAKPAWKWDPTREVRFIPMEDIETLFEGLREYYAGATLLVEDKSLTL